VGTSRDVEADEVFVVVQGRATISKADGSVMQLKPGTVGVLRAGEVTTWNVLSPLRKVWITPKKLQRNGRVAIVTGCGNRGGIGYACALALLCDGYHVVVSSTTGRIHERVADLVAEAGCGEDRVRGMPCNLTEAAAPLALVSLAVSAFGGVDVVVNNAGMTSILQPSAGECGELSSMSRESWRLSMARNLESAVFMTQAALPHLQKSSSGRVVVISSITGPLMCCCLSLFSIFFIIITITTTSSILVVSYSLCFRAMRGEVAYAAAKAALCGFVRALAVDSGASGAEYHFAA
jgi:3-oxoacyl-[acyl-carrier protein] reductase